MDNEASMHGKFQDKLRDKIRDNRHLDAYEKEVLDAVFQELYRMQEDTLGRIGQAVMREFQCLEPAEESWDIVTALIAKEEVEDARENGFREMLRIDANAEVMDSRQLSGTDGYADGYAMEGTGTVFSAGVAFLDCSYSQVREYREHTYQALVRAKGGEWQMPYRLEPWDAYLHQEEILERTAMQYGVKKPPIYSPMARRAVLVKVDLAGCGVSAREDFQIDFRHQANGLAGILKTGKTLVWNVEMTGQEQMPRPKENVNKKVVPLFQEMRQIYTFDTEEKEFIYVQGDDAGPKKYQVKKDGDTVYVGILEKQDISAVRYMKVKIHDHAMDYVRSADAFAGFYCQAAVYKERIRAKADVQYVVGQFQSGLDYLDCGMGSGQEEGFASVEVYDKRDAYHYPKGGRLKSSAYCYVRFKDAQDKFFEDRVSYAMAYMNYFYPEFYWAGVV